VIHNGSDGEAWHLIVSGANNYAFNMAFDEALLEAMPRLRKPVLRFYGWSEAAASFGYFQRYVELERLTLLRPLVRRPTGGGLVPHDNDWTYSLTFPTSHLWYSLPASESYRRVHEWLQAAFQRVGIPTELAEHSRKSSPGQCFVGYERFDLLWRGMKIAGAAQRRRRDGLLIQGSIQPFQRSAERKQWEHAMSQVGSTYGIDWQSGLEREPALNQRAHELAATKYSQADYNCKR